MSLLPKNSKVNKPKSLIINSQNVTKHCINIRNYNVLKTIFSLVL